MDKILVVEDEIDILNLTKVVLEGSGYNVVAASNAGEAFLKAEAEMPDLIIMDVVMPGKTGFDACKVLKFQPKTMHIPIVIFSVLSRDVDKKSAQESGADGYLLKPFTQEGLLAEVKKHLDKQRPYKFSRKLGVEHVELKGKKILLEYDPSSSYERFIRDFAIESAFYDEDVVVFTKKESIVQQALEGDEGVKFADSLGREKGIYDSVRSLQEDRSRMFSIIYDNLTDFTLSSDFQSVYNFTKNTLSRTPTSMVTAIFLLNPSAHEQREVYGFRGLFGSQVVYVKEGIKDIRIT